MDDLPGGEKQWVTYLVVRNSEISWNSFIVMGEKPSCEKFRDFLKMISS